jgi:hypothetical protein
MPEHVPHPIAKPVPESFDDVVDRVTARTSIAAILDQGHLGIGRAQNVVPSPHKMDGVGLSRSAGRFGIDRKNATVT